MKKLLLPATAVSLIVVAPAWFVSVGVAEAEPGEASFDLSTSAPKVCQISSDPSVPNSANAELSGSMVTFNNLFDTNAHLTSTQASINLSYAALCNSPHTVTLRSERGAMRLPAGTEPTTEGVFNNFVGYNISTQWPPEESGGDLPSLSAFYPNEIAIEAFNNVDQAVNNTITMHITTGGFSPNPGKPFLAGTYSDTVTLSLEPRT